MESRVYEAMIALDTGVSSSDIDALMDKLKSLVVEAKGEVKGIDRAGVRKLAFKVRGRSECQFCLLTYKAPSTVVQQIEQALRLHEGVVRYMTTRVDPALPVPSAPSEAQPASAV